MLPARAGLTLCLRCSYGDIGATTCGGFIGFNVSAVPDVVADANLKADAETMMGWGMDSLKVPKDLPPVDLSYRICGALCARWNER